MSNASAAVESQVPAVESQSQVPSDVPEPEVPSTNQVQVQVVRHREQWSQLAKGPKVVIAVPDFNVLAQRLKEVESLKSRLAVSEASRKRLAEEQAQAPLRQDFQLVTGQKAELQVLLVKSQEEVLKLRSEGARLRTGLELTVAAKTAAEQELAKSEARVEELSEQIRRMQQPYEQLIEARIELEELKDQLKTWQRYADFRNVSPAGESPEPAAAAADESDYQPIDLGGDVSYIVIHDDEDEE